MKKKILLSSILTIALCLYLMAGATFALFTAEDKVSVAVTAAKVELNAFVDDESIKLYSIDKYMGDGVKTFQNGGTASVNANGELVLERFTPGDKVTFDIVLENNSNIQIQYRVDGSVDGSRDLRKALLITSEERNDPQKPNVDTWTVWNVPSDSDQAYRRTTVTIELPVKAGNECQTDEVTITFTVKAVQFNGLDQNGDYLVP
jgi:predicted ribosomally synthesized peptide with SipW-like signal peptide